MGALKSPRFWLFAWGGLGALIVLYVIIAASVQPRDGKGREGPLLDQSLLVGEMANFEYAIPPRGAPDASFQTSDGEASLADFKGKVVLVNFWASFCAPCLKELPTLDALEKEMGGEDFQVLAIAADPMGPEKAAQTLEKIGVKNLKLYTDQRLRLASSVGGVSALPVSVLYDRKGMEIGRIVGEADWTSPEVKRLIRAAANAS